MSGFEPEDGSSILSGRMRVKRICNRATELKKMKKRVIIVHGWGGAPSDGWFPWLKEKIEERGDQVVIPAMPEPNAPHIDAWVRALFEVAGVADAQTFFVGHSMGCAAIVRYCEALPEGALIGGAVFVAGFFKRVTALDQKEEEREILREWLDASVDFSAAATRIKKSIAIFSDNDPYVPIENVDDFRDKLGSEIIIVPGAGHFSGPRDGTRELPIVLESILKIS